MPSNRELEAMCEQAFPKQLVPLPGYSAITLTPRKDLNAEVRSKALALAIEVRDKRDAEWMQLLRYHWLAAIDCDHGAKKDRVSCACSARTFPWMDSVGDAVGTWLEHVRSLLSGIKQ